MKATLLTLEQIFSTSERISLAQFMNKFGPESFLVLIFILISPNLIPFLSQFGIAEFTSGMVCLLSLQLMFGRNRPWLPAKFANKEMSSERINVVSAKIFPFLYKMDILTAPRLKLLSVEKSYRFYGVMFFILSLLILLPLPLFNYAPAVVIMLSIIGLLSRDGFLLMLGMTLFAAILVGLTFAISLMI